MPEQLVLMLMRVKISLPHARKLKMKKQAIGIVLDGIRRRCFGTASDGAGIRSRAMVTVIRFEDSSCHPVLVLPGRNNGMIILHSAFGLVEGERTEGYSREAGQRGKQGFGTSLRELNDSVSFGKESLSGCLGKRESLPSPDAC